MTSRTFAIKNGLYVTMDDAQPFVKGHMVVQEGRIVSLGDEDHTPIPDGYEVIDGKGKLYMPGLINTHGHAAMTLLRGFADDLALQVWLEEQIWPNEAKFTATDIYWGSQLALVEMLKGGTTCFVDMYDHMDQVAKAVEESGMRACLARGMIAFGSPEVVQAKLADARAFSENWEGQAEGRITTMLSPHAPYTCPPDFIEKVIDIATELDLPIHTHMSETVKEVLDNEQQYGLRPVAHLQKLGVFSRPCLVAHAVHLTDEEIEILAEHDVRVSHNPGSNLKLASGIARVPELIQAGVVVSLGTDSAASNNNLDMFEEIRLAALLHKGVSGDPTAIPAWEALRMGTVNGAKSIGYNDLGVLKAGYKADFIALDIDQVHYLPKTNYISHLVYAAAAKDVRDVWVDGRQLVRNGELTTLDEEKIKHEFNACYDRLMF